MAADLTINLSTQGVSLSTPLKLLLLLTLLSLAPSLLIMFTSFVRIVIVLALIRQAIGTPTIPPNQVIISLALFLTFYIMFPIFQKIYTDAFVPYIKNEISDTQFLQRVEQPIKEFMLINTQKSTLKVFMDLAKIPPEERTPDKIPMYVLAPAFLVSEIKTAFEIVFLLYLPFLVIDIVVATILIGLGVFMLPPTVISLPLKLMLFVLVNGWELLTLALIKSYSLPK
ncbi:MAG: flagellar type III secretion system pore protein FliP [Aquificae bacterium]|jgi:flagellar biosynthetic protein FliP|nr:flagellar type III secretion system pore protein FliP [Aquificota bacterium]